MGALLSIGFTMSANMFNKRDKNYTTFCNMINTARMAKLLTGRPHLKQISPESGLTDLYAIPINWMNLEGVFVCLKSEDKPDGKWMQDYLKQTKYWVQKVTVFFSLFISVHKEDFQPDFREQFWDIQQSNSLIFPKYFGFFVPIW